MFVSLSRPSEPAIARDPRIDALERELGARDERVAELEKALQSRDVCIAELEKAVQARDDFLSVAAHELSNPMHALSMQLALNTRLMKARSDRAPGAAGG